MYKKHVFTAVFISAFFSAFFPFLANAATSHPKVTAKVNAKAAPKTAQKVVVAPFEISAWIPYWRKATGTTEVISHISQFGMINPFGFTVKSDGTITDTLKYGEEPWTTLVNTAKQNKTLVLPSFIWNNADEMDSVLRDPVSRAAHIANIVALVQQYNFDGIDIDYEGKKADTKDSFSAFLKETKKSLSTISSANSIAGTKILSCTIEARTPLDSRFKVVPTGDALKNFYSNDFVAINKYCDKVKIMAYDQGTIDLVLNKDKTEPYVPISDPKWVEKVVQLAVKEISAKKISLGIATYGYEYTITPLERGFKYVREASFNPRYASIIASSTGAVAKRNAAGELTMAYPNPVQLVENSPALLGTSNNSAETPGSVSATVSFSGASTTAVSQTKPSFRLLWWSDAKAISDKIALAKKLGLGGVSIFKIDGGEDQGIWDVLPKNDK